MWYNSSMTNEKTENTPFDLNLHVARLLQSEPFFASISRRVNKSASTAIPTAGVRVNPETAQFELIYNPSFFEKLTDLERADVLKHEFYHLILGHVTNRLVNKDPKAMKLWNIAADLAINSYIHEELPDIALVPGEKHFSELPKYQSAEWYYDYG